MTTTQEFYQTTVSHWPSAERLRLAALILQDLTATVSLPAEAKTSALDLLEQLPMRPAFDGGRKELVASSQLQRGAAMSAALEALAARNSLADIADPVAWQREQRTERSLPEREGHDN